MIQELLRNNTLLMWHDYTQGSATDLGTTNNGTATGTTYYNRNGIKLNGVNGYVDILDSGALSFGDGSADTGFSVVVLVNSQPVISTPLITKGVYNTSGEYRLSIESDGKIYWQTYDESEADCYIGRLYNTAVSDQNDGKLFIVGTYDGSGTSAGFKIYLNGVQVDDTDSENNPGNYVAMENLAANLFVGRDNTTYGDATFGHSMVVGTELDSTEVAQLYGEIINKSY